MRYTFLFVGVACLGVYFYSTLERTVYQSYEGWKFDHRTSEQVPVPPARQPRNAPHSAIGRISIPRLHLATMVREGDTDEVLRDAVGHIPSTVLPGQPGNVGVAGHRDSFFRELRHLEKNDEIHFWTFQGDFTYRVDSIMIVTPDNVAVLDSEPVNSLTIVTCYPFTYIGNAPRRFVVRAHQTTTDPVVSNAGQPPRAF